MSKIIDKWLEFNSSRYRLGQVNETFARSMPKQSLVLDAGCGDAPYKHLFTEMRYESADFKQSDRQYDKQITYVCDLADIPVKDKRFDYIVCNQVFEHLPKPEIVLREFYRVLKPGGKIVLTAPLFYQEHEQPYDFFRYTQYGWRQLADNAGLKVESISAMEGFFGMAAYLLDIIYRNLRTNRLKPNGNIWKWRLIVPLLVIIRIGSGCSAAFLHRLECRMKLPVPDVGSKNYVVIMEK